MDGYQDQDMGDIILREPFSKASCAEARRGGRDRGPWGGNDDYIDELNGQGNDQGLGANKSVEGVNENVEGVNGGVGGAPDFSTIIAQQLQNLLPAILAQMESVQDMSGCSIDQKVKYTDGSFVGKALTWWNSQIRTLSQEVSISMSWNDFKFMMIEEFCPSHEMQKLEIKLWNHAIVEAGHAAYTNRFHELVRLVPQLVTPESRKIERNGSIKKVEKRGNRGEPSKDKNGRDDNKRTMSGKLLLQLQTLRNRPNQVVANYEGQVHRNQWNQAKGRAFMLEPKEARQDPNIMTGTFTLNNHFATTLFDSRADYSFISTTFIPLLGIEPSELGFRYEIEITSGQLVEIDKVIKGCKLEIEGHVFNIDLIPFRHGSFDVIIGMDWLSNHKAKIICHEKVVRIPLLDGKVLRVLGKRPKEKARLLMSTKTRDKKQEEIFMVRDFPEVFLDDLLGFPPLQEIEFQVELTPGAIPVAKSPYCLAPSELEELHLINGNGIYVDPSKIEAVNNWKAPRTPFEVRSFLGLAGYCHRFIENFSKIAKSLTILTQKSKTFNLGEEQELAFQTLKDRLCNAPILALPNEPEDFLVYCDTSCLGLGCMLMQR
nr:putative reverse transcriptase domain-containing protein [Tanacetum cinerariifolium]